MSLGLTVLSVIFCNLGVDSVTELNKRELAFNIQQFYVGAGGALGYLLAGLFGFNGRIIVFYVAVVFLIICLILTLFSYKETPRPPVVILNRQCIPAQKSSPENFPLTMGEIKSVPKENRSKIEHIIFSIVQMPIELAMLCLCDLCSWFCLCTVLIFYTG